MKVRLAIAAAVLALGGVAFTPTSTAAVRPSGFVGCHAGKDQQIFFGPGQGTIGDVIRHCRFVNHGVVTQIVFFGRLR